MSLLSLEDAKQRALEASRVKRTGAIWRSIARREQLRPDDCDVFILSGGRGSGKTRAGAEDTLERVRSGEITRVHVLAPTFGDARDVCIEGDSGILKCALPGEVKNWNRSMGEMTFSNGVFLKIFSGEEPDRLNGPQCGHLWVDEYWAVPIAAIDQAMFGLRIGSRITSSWTSTPKPTVNTKYVHGLEGATIRRMRMRDNAENLAPEFVDKIEKKYGGTRLGRVEIDGEDIEDVEGALWSSTHFDWEGFRLAPCFVQRDGIAVFQLPQQLVKIVVALDPTVSDKEKKKNPHKDPDKCGLIVAGCDRDANGYVLGDFTKIMPPSEWARGAMTLANLTKANGIVAEANQGGELIREVLLQYGHGIPIELVHASIGKRPRAEPVAMLYDQERVRHCGEFRDLEDQMTTWDASDPSQPSPNNVDALVWAFHGLGLCNVQEPRQTSRYRRRGRE